MQVLVNGVRLFFDVEGAKLVPDGPVMREKPTILLLHGGPGFDHSIYKPAFSALADVAQVIFLDHRGKVRGRVNERRRCNLRFAVRTSGATNARTEGDTACEREDHRARRGVKGGVGNAGSVRAAGRATPLAAGAGRRSG